MEMTPIIMELINRIINYGYLATDLYYGILDLNLLIMSSDMCKATPENFGKVTPSNVGLRDK